MSWEEYSSGTLARVNDHARGVNEVDNRGFASCGEHIMITLKANEYPSYKYYRLNADDNITEDKIVCTVPEGVNQGKMRHFM